MTHVLMRRTSVSTVIHSRAQRARAGVGFSLLELIFVIAIIGLLSALVLPNLFSQGESAKVQTTRAQMQSLQAGVEQFRTDVGRYPSEAEGLQALIVAPVGLDESAWKGPYLQRETLPSDGWNQMFVYKLDSAFGFRIISLGSDGAEGGDDYAADIDNRE